VFFRDPDGLKLEGMKYGEAQARTARKKAAASNAAKRKTQRRPSRRAD
jgi:hypothetical protein